MHCPITAGMAKNSSDHPQQMNRIDENIWQSAQSRGRFILIPAHICSYSCLEVYPNYKAKGSELGCKGIMPENT